MYKHVDTDVDQSTIAMDVDVDRNAQTYIIHSVLNLGNRHTYVDKQTCLDRLDS